jgi:hypothetical protein
MERGWGPLNYRLLDHPELIGVESVEAVVDDCSLAASALLDIASINTSGSKFNGFVDLFVNESIRDEGRRKKYELEVQATRERNEGFSKLSAIARLTSGQLGVVGHFNLDAEVYEKAKVRQQEQDIKIRNALEKKQDCKNKAENKFNGAYTKYKENKENLRADDLKVLLRRVQRKNDSPIRTKIRDLQDQFHRREQRLSGMPFNRCGDEFYGDLHIRVPQTTAETYRVPETGVENTDDEFLLVAL